ncbi:HET-domain-containing protein [Hypoxylon sp. FL1857]|nr:HET-domain-containing protein [Hypoxylon sp. FL1857]
MASTYRDLITAIPPSLNLSNVVETSPSRPCAACARFTPDRSRAKRLVVETEYELFDTFPDFPVLKASARSGCALCRLLRKGILSSWAIALRPMEQEGLGVLSTKDGVWDEFFDMPWDRKVRIFHAHFYLSTRNLREDERHPSEFVQKSIIRFGPANLPKEEDGWPYKRQIHQELEFKVFDSADTLKTEDSDDESYARRPPDSDALSECNTALMKEWISTCRNYHKACQPDASTKWLPTRLLEISSSSKFDVRLVETHALLSMHLECPVQFMALSHMWGDASISPPLRTLKSNYDRMKQGIPMRELPQNFVDTILVCRKLGVEYVWIDSLCIIQDSPEDWKREAVTMHLVYKYAQATIVAAAAKSSRDGFLVRNTRMTPAVKIAYPSESSGQANPWMILYPSSEESQRDFEYEDSQWNTRGWTFQERYLSTRLLYFCKNMLHFECRTCKCSEEGESAIFANPSNSLWPRAKLPTDTWFKIWSDMIIKYTMRKLTYGDDKLIAVQSIVNEMKEHVPGPYIEFAGVWQANIHKDLLWRPWAGIPTYPDNYRAPSWSWASTDGGVTFSSPTSRPNRQYGDALEVARFNEGVPAEIIVKAHTRRITSIVGIDPGDLFDVADMGEYQYDIFTDDLASSDGHQEPEVFAHGIPDRLNHDNILGKSAEFMYLHVCDSRQPSGLILKKQTLGANEGSLNREVWVRVGSARVFKDLGLQPIVNQGFEGQEKSEVIII